MDKKLDIDLGHSAKELYGEPLSVPDAKEKSYPSFHHSGTEELPIPDSGTMTIEYKVVSETNSKRDGKERYECTIEVRKIVSVGKEVVAPAKRDTSTNDALDALMAKHEAEEEGEDKD